MKASRTQLNLAIKKPADDGAKDNFFQSTFQDKNQRKEIYLSLTAPFLWKTTPHWHGSVSIAQLNCSLLRVSPFYLAAGDTHPVQPSS